MDYIFWFTLALMAVAVIPWFIGVWGRFGRRQGIVSLFRFAVSMALILSAIAIYFWTWSPGVTSFRPWSHFVVPAVLAIIWVARHVYPKRTHA